MAWRRLKERRLGRRGRELVREVAIVPPGVPIARAGLGPAW